MTLPFSNDNVRSLWARTRPAVWPGTYWMVAFEPEHARLALDLLGKIPPRTHYCSLIGDQHEVAVILPDQVWRTEESRGHHRDVYGPLACVTLDVPLDISVSGFLAPAIRALTEAEISIVPQCALIFDHILVSETNTTAAVGVLETLRQTALKADH